MPDSLNTIARVDELCGSDQSPSRKLDASALKTLVVVEVKVGEKDDEGVAGERLDVLCRIAEQRCRGRRSSRRTARACRCRLSRHSRKRPSGRSLKTSEKPNML